jgi:cell wall-associated NlpC family hydrolase
MYSGEDDIQVAGDVTREYTVDLYNWNIKNNSMYNGNIIVKGSNKYQIGTRLNYTDEGLEFYIEGVTHNFTMFGSFITELAVTRGLPKDKRFTSPWDAYTPFVPEGVDSSGGSTSYMQYNPLQLPSFMQFSDSATLNTFVAAARSRVGLPYVWGGNGPNNFDCSGLVKWSLNQAGYNNIPRTASLQYKHCIPISKKDLQIGDLVFVSSSIRSSDINHVGIYAGNNKVIEAANSKVPLREVPMYSHWNFFGRLPINR